MKAAVVKVCALALALVAFSACSAHSAGNSGRAPGPAHRIVSLIPSLTEDLCAIGAGAQLVGISAYGNDSGACARGLPVVANFSSIDTERVVQLHPDAVVGIPEQQAMTGPLRRAGIRTVLMSDDSYGDIFADIAALGEISGRTAQAQKLTRDLQEKTAALRASEHFSYHPRVFFVVQALPIWTTGSQSYISTLIRFAGGRNAVTELPQPYAEYSAEALVRLQPDAVISTKDAQLQAVLAREPWRSLRAVQQHRVYILSDDSIVVRPGPRYNQGLRWFIDRLAIASAATTKPR